MGNPRKDSAGVVPSGEVMQLRADFTRARLEIDSMYQSSDADFFWEQLNKCLNALHDRLVRLENKEAEEWLKQQDNTP